MPLIKLFTTQVDAPSPGSYRIVYGRGRDVLLPFDYTPASAFWPTAVIYAPSGERLNFIQQEVSPGGYAAALDLYRQSVMSSANDWVVAYSTRKSVDTYWATP